MAATLCRSTSDYMGQLSALLSRLDCRGIDAFAQALFDAWREDRRVFVFGNGGSAFTASHYVCDLVKTAAVDGQKRLRAFGLADNTGLTTAIGNDLSYEDAFVYPREAYAQKGDIAVAISASGNSPNVLKACQWAREHGLSVVAITGFSGGRVKALADIHINIPSDNFGLVEDLHLSVGHIAAQMLHQRVAAGGAK
jgi:D-sedoheptulose 7-phosphate isomerase